MFGFDLKGKVKECEKCGYKISPPIPQKCPRCGDVLEKVGFNIGNEEKRRAELERTRESVIFDIASLSSQGDSTIGKNISFERDDEKVEESFNIVFLGDEGDYLKLLGVIDLKTREILFCNNSELEYILELGANAHEIATSILGGKLERILFEPPRHLSQAIGVSVGQVLFDYEEAYFAEEGDLLFCIYGVFFKRPEILIQQLQLLVKDILGDLNPSELPEIRRHEIKKRALSFTSYVLKEYTKIRQDVLHKPTVPTLEKIAKIHYLGVSHQSVGAMALLLTPVGEDALPIKDIPFEGDTNDGMYQELVESLISAKIEAIAANTLAHIGAFPRYIVTRLGFDRFRLIAFYQLENEYYLQVVASGNASVVDLVISQKVLDKVSAVTSIKFTGVLKEFNEVKEKLYEELAGQYVFELQDSSKPE